MLATSSSSASLASTSTLAPKPSNSLRTSRSKCPFYRSSSSGGDLEEGAKKSTTTSIDDSLRKSESSSQVSMTSMAKPKKCENKDALCRAMGTLFLQHRVDKLQQDVDELQEEKVQRRKCDWGGGWSSGCRKSGSSAIVRPDRPNAKESLEIAKEKGDIKAELLSLDRSNKTQRHRKIIIADVSLLIYSLRTVYNWLKEEDCQVIVPAEALRTLDVLKKGNHCLNLAARKATRFLDEKFVYNDSNTDQASIKPGLYAQRSSQKVTVAEWRSLEMTIQGELGEIGHSHEAIMDLPHSIRETLACTLYFIRQHILYPSSTETDRAEPSVHLALALPPPHFDCADEADIHSMSQNIKYGQRADGSTLLQVAKELNLGNSTSMIGNILIVAPTAASWLTVNPSKQTKV